MGILLFANLSIELDYLSGQRIVVVSFCGLHRGLNIVGVEVIIQRDQDLVVHVVVHSFRNHRALLISYLGTSRTLLALDFTHTFYQSHELFSNDSIRVYCQWCSSFNNSIIAEVDSTG